MNSKGVRSRKWNITLDWVKFIDIGILPRDSGFDVLGHTARGDS